MSDSDGNRRFGLQVGAASALMGAYLYMGLKTPVPGEDQDVSSGLTVEKYEFTTGDGAILRLKRYANPDGTPVLFCHGFNGNGFEFDLPRENHNIAVYLARRGYDVWISSFRGCGREPYKSEAGDWKHSIDHLAIYDASALVDGVTGATGKKPFWIGHSMGGMVLYMYLQGVRFEGDLVVSDPELVAEHHQKLAGGIPIASPPAFWWPRLHPFQVVTDSSIGRSLIGLSMLLTRQRNNRAPRFSIGLRVCGLAGWRPRLIKAVSRSPLGVLLYCRRNTDPDTTTSLIKWAGDDVSTRMLIQLTDGIWNKNFRQYFPMTFRKQPYDYTENMHLISLPIFYVTGEKDFANCVGIKRYGYDRAASEIKKFVALPGYGHTDLVMGRDVEQEVYPLIYEWLQGIEGKGPGLSGEGAACGE